MTTKMIYTSQYQYKDKVGLENNLFGYTYLNEISITEKYYKNIYFISKFPVLYIYIIWHKLTFVNEGVVFNLL